MFGQHKHFFSSTSELPLSRLSRHTTLRHPRQDIMRPSSQGLSVNGMAQDRTALQWGGSGQKTCATFFIHPSRFPRLRADKTISP